MRPEILPLDAGTINRIAAGEVVEGPASVLKELLENALDAGATRIELEIAGGGVMLLKLSDDGHGIPVEQLAEALRRHSTSKIRSLADLEKASTLGFRGEALAAIASVSLLEICSRVEESDSAWQLTSRNGDAPRPAARERGTVVTVRELFGDVPARRKFLRSEAGEKRRLLTLWHSYLLAYPELDFVLREGGREVSNYPAAGDLAGRVAQVLGDSTARHMVEVDAEFDGYRVTGLTTLPLISRGNRSHQYVYLGRRPILDKQVSHAIAQAYADVLAPGRFPTCLLYLEVPRGMVDVNVHPAKREVRFREGRKIHHVVGMGLRQAIGSRGDLGALLSQREDLLLGAQRGVAGKPEAPITDLFGGRRAGGASPTGGSQRPMNLGWKDGGIPTDSSWDRGSLIRFDIGRGPDEAAPSTISQQDEDRLFWQLHNTFILTQIRGGLVIIDQHNAHERVLYDRAIALKKGEQVGSQRLLFPHTVELDAAEMEAFRQQAGFLGELGFMIEEFGQQTISIVGIPETLQRWDGGQVIRDILDDVVAETGGPTERRNRALISFSCKSAIKAGEAMREEEMRHLVDQLFGTKNPYTCPHGRPIVIRISMDELEKRFFRTVPGEKKAR